jgi:hypothetical protein
VITAATTYTPEVDTATSPVVDMTTITSTVVETSAITTTIAVTTTTKQATTKLKTTAAKKTATKKAKVATTAASELNKRAVTKASRPFTCPRDGYFPDPDVCSKYFLCAGASVTQHDCGEGLVWDAELQLCGWSNTIECRNGNRPWEKITDFNGSTQIISFFQLFCQIC